MLVGLARFMSLFQVFTRVGRFMLFQFLCMSLKVDRVV